MNATDRIAALIASTVNMIERAGWDTCFDAGEEVQELPRPAYTYVEGRHCMVDLDAAALRDVYRALLVKFGPRDAKRANSCAWYYNDQIEADGIIETNRAGRVGPVQHLNALVWTLMAEQQEAAYEADRAENDLLNRADAFWTAVSNGASHDAARSLAMA